MAGKGAILSVKIISDASEASKGFDQAESRADRFGRGLDRASVAATGVIAGIGLLAKGAFDAASALQQSTGAIDSVFGDWALDIEQAAQKASQAVGLSTSAYENSAALIGAQLKSMGFPIADNVRQTQALIGVGADLAATFGGTTQQAVDALSSALKGERDPIERYGITLSQAAVDAKVAALGLDTSTDAAKRNASAQATLALITDQAGGALGAFAREGDTAAGAQQRASAEFENAQAVLGEKLLPLVADGATKLSQLATWVAENSGLVSKLAIIFGIAAAAIWVVNFALAANPFTLIALAIAAVIAIIVICYQRFEGFRDFVKGIGNAIVTGWQWFFDKLEWLGRKLETLKNAAKSVGNFVGGLFGAPGPGPAGGAAVGGGPAAGAPFGSPAGGAPTLFGASGSMTGDFGSAASRSTQFPPPAPIIIRLEHPDPVAYARSLRAALDGVEVQTGRSVTVAL